MKKIQKFNDKEDTNIQQKKYTKNSMIKRYKKFPPKNSTRKKIQKLNDKKDAKIKWKQ